MGEVRQWCWANGINVARVGAIPAAALTRWNKEHPDRQVPVRDLPRYGWAALID